MCILSMDTMHPKDPLVPVGSEGFALAIPLFILSLCIIMLCHCSLTMTKDHFLVIFGYIMALKGLCVLMCLLNPRSYISSTALNLHDLAHISDY